MKRRLESLDDVIEHAKTGRAKCRRCAELIGKGDLRFGERVENPFGEGEATQWFHMLCAAEKRPEKLSRALLAFVEEVADRALLEEACQDGIENPKLTNVRRAERSPTGRARCQHCREPIAKESLRIAIERDDDMPMASASFIHAGCAKAALGEARLWNKLRRVSAPALDPEGLEALRVAVEA